MGETRAKCLEVNNLSKFFPLSGSLLRKRTGTIRAVDGVSFSIYRSETLGLVGESGCGKTTTGRLIIKAFPPTSGQIAFHDDTETIDVTTLEGPALKRYRRQVQLVFQDPYASLNPRLTVRQIVAEPLVCLTPQSANERNDHVAELLNVVGLDPRYADRYPHAFSGGQRQRIGIARALAVSPDLIIADEAVSALDVSIQAQIINLMKDLQQKFGLAYLFITHDLGVVHHISDRVAVMYVGKIVELAPTDDLFFAPRHPYTEALLASLPQPDPDIGLQELVLQGDVADPSNKPTGCSFHPRCRYAQDRCRVEEPPLSNTNAEGDSQHLVACHFSESLSLAGTPEAV